MTKEELEKEAEENSFRFTLDKPWACEVERKQIMAHFEKGYLVGAEPREKRITELEAQISNLLSCKNCPDNKGGLLCQKEYEDKCLAQKIQYIKELQEENAELKAVERMTLYSKMSDQLTKAKELIKRLIKATYGEGWNYSLQVKVEAEQFLKEEYK